MPFIHPDRISKSDPAASILPNANTGTACFQFFMAHLRWPRRAAAANCAGFFDPAVEALLFYSGRIAGG